MNLRRIGDLTDPVLSWNPRQAEGDIDFTYIDISSVDRESKAIVAPQEVSTLEAPSRARRIVKEGDVLVATVRPNLNGVACVPGKLHEATASTGFTVLRPNGLVNSRYLFHWVRSPQFISDMSLKATGQSYPAVSDGTVKDSLMFAPPVDEQRRIGQVLDQIDDLRAKRREAISLLDELVQSIFLEMFGDLGSNPMNWDTMNIGDVIVNAPQNGLYKRQEFYGSGCRIARIDSFYSGKLIDHSRLKRVSTNEGEIEKYVLHEGDILINRVNSIEYLGKSALVEGMTEPAVFESNMMRFSVDRSLVEPAFVVAALQSPHIYSQIVSAAKKAVNQASINQTDVKFLNLYVPPLDLQNEFVKRSARISTQKEQMLGHLAELDALFASLQDRAFRGELWTEESAPVP